MERLRIPAVAGSFYPDDSVILKRDIDQFLENANPSPIEGQIRALIAPHAGYIYSGSVAAWAYKTLEGKKYDAVVVIAPSHYVPFHGVSIYKGDGYQMPMGIVPIHQEFCQKLMAQNEIIHYVPGAHVKEHAVEVQLPFLQRVMPDFKLVPMIMGSQDYDTCSQIADALFNVFKDKNVLIVASSDLSHYYTYNEALKLDNFLRTFVENFDPQGLSSAVDRGLCEACGAGPMICAMLAAKKLGAGKSKVLNYANSGDVSGNRGQVVGYLAAAFYDDGNPNGKLTKEEENLSEEDKKILRGIAQESIEKSVKGEPMPEIEILSPVLREKRGGFVTIKKRGQLRGCIGYIYAYKPLFQTIEEMARAAALDDPRFNPVDAGELPELELEISVLTPMRLIKSVDEIEVGKHGLYIQQGRMSGLLLPQVASEYKWDKITFLQQTCHKAGLPADAWKDQQTKIYIFSADVF